METKGLGSIANNGKYYSPKYWVMKWKDKDDVVIETANKSLTRTMELSESIYTEQELENTDLYEYISIEIKKVLTYN